MRAGRLLFVVIRASSSRQISALLTDLASDRPLTRDAAVARLTVIGPRASEPLAALAGNREAPPVARAAALRVLEATGDPRGLDAALQAIADRDATVAVAAVGATRVHLRGPRGAAALDRLTTLALDRGRPASTRLAAVQSLTGLELSTVRPLMDALRDDPVRDIAEAAAATAARRGAKPRPPDPKQVVSDAATGRLPADPEILRRAFARDANALPLLQVLEIVEHIRRREQTAGAAERPRWTSARAAAHLALARRGSRIALYDIRETLECTEDPLPVEFLAALGAVGDTLCLEAIAAACAVSRPADEWWRRHLAETFRAIVARERITRRHAAIRKIEKRWPKAFKDLWAGRAGKAGRAGGSGKSGG